MPPPMRAHEVRIRPARAAEHARLSAIAIEAKCHWGYAPELIDGWRADLAVTPAQIEQGVGRVAEWRMQPCGVAVARPGDPWELQHLWVRPAAMRQGIGRALLQEVADAAWRRGARVLRIVSDPFAAGFYRALGARDAGVVAAPIPDEPLRALPVFLFVLRAPPP